MPWYHAVAESRHELQNPTSPDKIRLLGERLLLGPEAHVLDVASGKSVPAVILASEFGCRVTCVELAAEFHEAARERVRAAGLEDRIELVQADGAEFPIEPGRYDAALCLGASFVWGGLRATIDALLPAVRERGFVAVGEPYLRGETPFEPFASLRDTVGVFEAAGLEPVTLIAASEDDWDRYESLHWLAIDEWLHANPDDPDAESIRATATSSRDDYLRSQRAVLGWAIVAGRKP